MFAVALIWIHAQANVQMFICTLFDNFTNASLQICFIMGLPAVLTSDQGREFHNAVNKELMQTFGIDHRLTTPYHPQANGLDERFNQTLINTLSKFAQDNRNSWDVKLQEVIYAYNTSVQESTKHNPFEAMFGRMARLPVDFNAGQYDPDAALEEYCAADEEDELDQLPKRRHMEEVIKTNILHAHAKQKQYYDQKHGAASCFGTGSVVLVKDFTRKHRRGGKLDYRWLGPFVITASLGKGLFQLKEVDGDKVRLSTIMTNDSVLISIFF